MTTRKQALTFLAGIFITAIGSAQEIEPPRRPHDVSHCDMPARAARNGAHPCMCVTFVTKVQDAHARLCWLEAGILTPPDVPMPFHLLPPEVAACIRDTPDHCNVIAHGVNWWRRKLKTNVDDTPPAGEAYNRCATSCRPERCGCVDGACASHGESNEY